MKKYFFAALALALAYGVVSDYSNREVRPLEIALEGALGGGAYPLTRCNKGVVQGQLFARCHSSQLWKVTENETGYTYEPYNGKAMTGLDKLKGHLPEGSRFIANQPLEKGDVFPGDVWKEISWDY